MKGARWWIQMTHSRHTREVGMAFATVDALEDDGGVTYGVLRGLPNAGDPLRLLGAVLSVEGPCRQRNWLIDNSMVDESLAVEDLAEFVRLARRRAERFEDVSVAWVSATPWGYDRQELVRELPFRFCHFESIDEAHCWLWGQLDR